MGLVSNIIERLVKFAKMDNGMVSMIDNNDKHESLPSYNTSRLKNSFKTLCDDLDYWTDPDATPRKYNID